MIRAARYFLALRSESLDELRDADVEHYIQSRGGPLSYYLRTFQFFRDELKNDLVCFISLESIYHLQGKIAGKGNHSQQCLKRAGCL